MNRFILQTMKQHAIFKDGREFNYLISSLQTKHILNNETQARFIYESAQSYQTNSQIYSVPLSFTLTSKDSLMKINFKKIGNSVIQLKLLDDSEETLHFSRSSIETGIKSFILDSNQKVQLKVLPSPQINLFTIESLEKDLNEVNLISDLQSLKFKLSKVVCSGYNILFVLEDESLYCSGQPLSNPSYALSYGNLNSKICSYKKDRIPILKLEKIDKPAECVDIRQVSVNSKLRLILTNSGQIFG